MKQSPARSATRPGASLPPAQSQAVQRAIGAHRELPGALLPILHAVQDALGHVPPDAIPLIAHELNLTRAEVHGVVSFYHHFRSTPAGRHVVRVCRAEACQARGVEAIAPIAEADPRIHVETVYCLGLCSIGPSAMTGDTVHARLDARSLAALVDRVAAA